MTSFIDAPETETLQPRRFFILCECARDIAVVNIRIKICVVLLEISFYYVKCFFD